MDRSDAQRGVPGLLTHDGTFGTDLAHSGTILADSDV